MKLEKTKELSRDTNRRRRALEQRRKNYEAEEEKQRQEILARRRKEIQEVTEKFQRANIVRSKRKINNNHLHYTKPNQKVKQHTVGSESVRKHVNTEVNGQQYYPSVEEVLAMLHADQANVIERLVSGETNSRLKAPSPSLVQAGDLHTSSPPCEQSPVLYHSNDEIAQGGEVTRETLQQHVIEQAKLRSEVVGRSQLKLAFGDETKDTLTEGVLPATIRQDSPSGSLSSLDSLDVVPDEVPEPAGSRITEGIMRKDGQQKRGYRVTFNESVIFSDSFVGNLKEKPEVEESEEGCSMEKQKSYFNIPTEEIMSNEQAGEETPGVKPFCNSDTKINEAVSTQCTQDASMSGHLASVQSTPSTVASELTSHANRYPCVTATEMTTSATPNFTRAATTNESTSKCTPDVAMLGHPALVKPTPSTTGSGLTSHANRYSCVVAPEMISGAASSYARVNGISRNTAGVEHSNASSLVRSQIPHSAAVSGGRYEYVHQPIASKSSLLSRYDIGESAHEITPSGVNRSRQRGNGPMSYSEVNGFHIDEKDGALHQVKTSEASSRRATFASINASMLKDSLEMKHESMDGAAGMQFTKATNALTVKSSVGSSTANHVRGTAEVAPDVPLIPVTKRDFLSKALLRTSATNAAMSCQTATSPDDSNSRNALDDSKQSFVSSYNKTNTPYYGNSYAGNVIVNVDHGNEHNDGYKQVYETDTRNNRGTVGGHNGTARGKVAKDTQVLRNVVSTTNDEASLNRQNVTVKQNNRNPAHNGSPRKIVQAAVQEDKQYTATRKRNSYDDPLKSVQQDLERISMAPAQHSDSRAQSLTTVKGRVASAIRENRRKPVASDHGRKHAKAKNGLNVNSKHEKRSNSKDEKRSNSKDEKRSNSRDEKRSNSTAKRLHKPAVELESEVRKQAGIVQYSPTQNGTQKYTTTDHVVSQRFSRTERENLDSESRSILDPRPSYGRGGTNAFAQKERSEGLILLDKTPTDEEINTLWETVRTCLKHEQTAQKAASDSIVNNVRHSRSTNGPLVGNHYLIDSNRWDPRSRPVTDAFGLNSPASEFRQLGTTTNGYASFRRQNSLDGLERRGSGAGSTASLPPQRKASLLEHRSHKTERRLTRTQQSARPPFNQKYFQALRGPTTSARGPQQSNTTKAEEANRPQLSYPEFQAVMQASAELQARNGENETQKRPQQALHQPIIMNYRKETSALSLEENRLLESLDRLNERLKVQEATTGKFTKGQRKLNISGNNASMANTTKFTQRSPNDNRFSNQTRKKGLATSPSSVNRR